MLAFAHPVPHRRRLRRPVLGSRGVLIAGTGLAVSCAAARTPVQVVEVRPPSEHGIAGQPAPTLGRPAPSPSAAQSCPTFASEPESTAITAVAKLPAGSLSVRVVHRPYSDDDVCLATLTDARGSVTACETFADEGCDMQVPVVSAESVTVEGVCITERCGAGPQRARRIFEVVAVAARRIEVRAETGVVVEECGGE